MRLNSHSDYAVRVLMQLASNPDRLCTIQEIADTYQISKNHLMKVAHALVKAGFVESVRGRNGGLRLSRIPSSITVADVLRAMEDEFAVLDCLRQNVTKPCHVAPACRLKSALSKATAAFIAVLDEYTIADTVADNGALHHLLALP